MHSVAMTHINRTFRAVKHSEPTRLDEYAAQDRHAFFFFLHTHTLAHFMHTDNSCELPSRLAGNCCLSRDRWLYNRAPESRQTPFIATLIT